MTKTVEGLFLSFESLLVFILPPDACREPLRVGLKKRQTGEGWLVRFCGIGMFPVDREKIPLSSIIARNA